MTGVKGRGETYGTNVTLIRRFDMRSMHINYHVHIPIKPIRNDAWRTHGGREREAGNLTTIVRTTQVHSDTLAWTLAVQHACYHELIGTN